MATVSAERQEGLRLPKFTVKKVTDLAKRPESLGIAALGALIIFAFLPWILRLRYEWFKPDSYVQHGVLVPFACVYIGWLAWVENRSQLPVRPTFWPVLALVFVTLSNSLVMRSGFFTLSGILMVASVALSVWSLMGGKWLWKMTPAILFSSFSFSLWGEYVDQLTLSAQGASSKLAVKFLELAGLHPTRSADDPNMVYLPHFDMDIGAACSGLKMTLAILTCAVFIVIVGKLRWWANLLLVAVVLPIALLFNSLRIAIIGLVGEFMGSQAGQWMHDYGSYGVMLLGFYVLYRLALLMGWKV